jgi:mannitol-1-phosphate/altronate dehydrogenase
MSTPVEESCRDSIPLTALNLSTIQDLRKENPCIEPLPLYNRELSSFEGLIYHIGVGVFHRSHQAVYTHNVLLDQLAEDSPAERWAIMGVSLHSLKTRSVLEKQDFLYSVFSRDQDTTKLSVVGSILDIALSSHANTLEMMADPRTRIVSLTITEKAYHIDLRSNKLDLSEPTVAHDLNHPNEPAQSAGGFIAQALKLRMQRGLLPFTVQSCDNLPGNGMIAKTMVLDFIAALKDKDFLAWAQANCKFPGSMVDRITPATKARNPSQPDQYSDGVRSEICKKASIKDEWPIVAEPFSQWVIEDNFVNGRPNWEAKGAQFVDDVAPFETMKLRLLNGSHSALSYVGYLLRHRFVGNAIDHSIVRSFLKKFMAEQCETVPPVPGVDLDEYQANLISRFENPYNNDTLIRLARDGSHKIVTSMREAALINSRAGRSVDAFGVVFASWARFSCGVDEEGEAIDFEDSQKEEVMMKVKEIFSGIDDGGFVSNVSPSRAAVVSLLAFVFGDDFASDDRIADTAFESIDKLARSSTRELIRSYLSGKVDKSENVKAQESK